MHVALCPMSRRQAAIPRLLDEWLAARGSVLRVADLSPHNRRALLRNPWRENLQALRQTAVRLDAIVQAGFSRKKAAAALGIPRQTFYGWFNETMRFVKPLVAEPQKPALLEKLATATRDRS
jgi:DNA-binding NtrC family response regulator